MRSSLAVYLILFLQSALLPFSTSSETCSAANNFKVITEIMSYDNPDRIGVPGETCEKDEDPGCLLRFLVYLDLDAPSEPQELAVNDVRYTEIFKTTEKGIAFMPVQIGGKIIAKDSCGKIFQGANLRVLTAGDDNVVVNSFSCLVPVVVPAPIGQDAVWSPMTQCDPALHGKSMELTFRYKVMEVSTSQCCLS